MSATPQAGLVGKHRLSMNLLEVAQSAGTHSADASAPVLSHENVLYEVSKIRNTADSSRPFFEVGTDLKSTKIHSGALMNHMTPTDSQREPVRVVSRRPTSVPDFVRRYPHLLARVAATGQLASIEEAAVVLRDALARRRNYSDWVLNAYRGDALQAIKNALRLER